MPMPSNGQNFVRPQSGGTGGWMAKLFGGIADDRRARQMAQIQFDLHQARAGVDTEHQGIRVKQKAAAEAAGKVYVGDANAKRAVKTYKKFTDPQEEYTDSKGRKRTRGGFGLTPGPDAAISGFDGNFLPQFQKTGQKKRNTSDANTVTTDTVDTPPAGGGKGAGKNPAGAAKPTAKKTAAKKTAAKKPASTKAAALDSTPSSTPVSTSTNGAAQPELFPGYGPTFDGQGNNTQSPKSKPSAVKKPKAPKTPKAGA